MKSYSMVKDIMENIKRVLDSSSSHHLQNKTT